MTCVSRDSRLHSSLPIMLTPQPLLLAVALSLQATAVELQDMILDFYLDIQPDSRRRVTSMSRHLRERLRHHRATTVEVYASDPFIPLQERRTSTTVLPESLPRLIADAEQFHSAFPLPACVSFGEIENLKINLPSQDNTLVQALQTLLSGLRRPVHSVKFTSWQDLMDLPDFMEYVGKLGCGLNNVRTLSLVFNHYGLLEEEDGDEHPVSCYCSQILVALTVCLHR